MGIESFSASHLEGARLTDQTDPCVSEILEKDGDKVGNLIEGLGKLTLKQKVHALLLLTDEEFEDFRQRRRDAVTLVLPGTINRQNDLTPQEKKEFIEEISRMRDSTPRFEVEAEIRRRNPKYPSQWDLDLDEDNRFTPNGGLFRLKDGKRISYEEAVEFTRFENTRLWYRNFVFPQLTRFDSALPLNLQTLIELLKFYRKESFRPEKPGTDISTGDLAKVCDYYLDREIDNAENCAVHREVKKLASLISAMEDAISS